jgi:hypothetical protein
MRDEYKIVYTDVDMTERLMEDVRSVRFAGDAWACIAAAAYLFRKLTAFWGTNNADHQDAPSTSVRPSTSADTPRPASARKSLVDTAGMPSASARARTAWRS